jgi:hypothetical protein
MTVSLAFVIMFLSSDLAANGIPTDKAILTGKIYCITAGGEMHGKEGVCTADHIAHLIITDDGRAYILGGSTEVLEQIRKAPLKASSKVKLKGVISPRHNAIRVEKWWEEYETIGD